MQPVLLTQEKFTKTGRIDLKPLIRLSRNTIFQCYY